MEDINKEKIYELLYSVDETNQELGLILAESQLGLSKEDLINERVDKLEFYSYYTTPPKWLTVCCPGIYAHGDLEKILKYDILLVPYKKHISKEGGFAKWDTGIEDEQAIYNVTINHNNELIKAVMFYWKHHQNRFKGLVVLASDKYSYNQVYDWYKNKEDFL